MEILIAILWYLQLIVPGQTYTLDNIETIYLENQSAFEVIQADPVLTDEAINNYNDTYDPNLGIIEQWDEEPDWTPVR